MQSLPKDIIFKLLDYCLKCDYEGAFVKAFLYGSKWSRTLLFVYTLDKLKRDEFYGNIIRGALQRNIYIYFKVKSWERSDYIGNNCVIDDAHLIMQCKNPGLYIAMEYVYKGGMETPHCILDGYNVPLWIFTGIEVFTLSYNTVQNPIRLEKAGTGQIKYCYKCFLDQSSEYVFPFG